MCCIIRPDLVACYCLGSICSLICNRNITCGDEVTLDCCKVIIIIGDYDMVITTLNNLYYVLSCRINPQDALSMQHGPHADSGDIGSLPRHVFNGSEF
jgi:hypothetical protein